MTGAELSRLKRRLLAEERYLEGEIDAQAAELQGSAEAAGEERSSGPDDAGAEIFEHEKVLAVEGAFQAMLAEVRHALHKMEAGNYGVCDDCGREIDLERLNVRPQATLCVACKVQEEHAHHGAGHAVAAGT